jgi:hypothetical protein
VVIVVCSGGRSRFVNILWTVIPLSWKWALTRCPGLDQALARPTARWPPPSGIRPSFLMSRNQVSLDGYVDSGG